MKIIDIHAHFFTPSVTAGIGKILKSHKIKETESAAVRTKREMLTAEERIQMMDKLGIDTSVIEYQIVWQHYDQAKYPAEVRNEIAAFINDSLAAAQKKYPTRFWMMADIPLVDVAAGIKELKRAKGLGAKGLRLNTNVSNQSIVNPKFDPFWAEVNKLGLPVTIHPSSDTETPRYLNSIASYPMDSTLAGGEILYSGFFDRFPKVNLMLCHCGGAFPWIKRRFERTTEFYGGVRLDKLLNKFYYDTAISFPSSIKFTIAEAGLDRICFGTDYPYFDIKENINTVKSLKLKEDETARIFADNALKFFGAK